MNVDVNGSVANDTIEKWSPVLEGIESDYTRRVTAQLLENQAKAISQIRIYSRLKRKESLYQTQNLQF